MPAMPAQFRRLEMLSLSLGRLGMAVLSFAAAVAVAIALLWHVAGPDEARRHWAEYLSFVGTIGLFLMAVPAFIVAWRHAEHIERSTRLQALSRLNRTMTRDGAAKGLAVIALLKQEYYAGGGQAGDSDALREFAKARLEDWRRDATPLEVQQIRELLEFLSDIESIAVYVRRGYVSITDVYYLYKGMFLDTELVLGKFFEVNFDATGDFEHTRWLMQHLGADREAPGDLLR